MKKWNIIFVTTSKEQENLLLKYAKVCEVVLKNMDESGIYCIDKCPRSQRLLDKFLNTLDVKQVFTDCHKMYDKKTDCFFYTFS